MKLNRDEFEALHIDMTPLVDAIFAIMFKDIGIS